MARTQHQLETPVQPVLGYLECGCLSCWEAGTLHPSPAHSQEGGGGRMGQDFPCVGRAIGPACGGQKRK